MFSKVYAKVILYSETKYASFVLSLVAFSESIIFPIPPDIVLIPMSLANKKKAFVFASLATIFSVLGGAIGYLLGSLLWIEIGEPLISYLGYIESYESFRKSYDKNGLVVVVMGAVTPFPFKIVAILSGSVGYPFSIFIIAAAASRGFRFFTLATIIYIWGDQINYFLKTYLSLIFLFITVVIIGSYWYLK